MSGVVASVAAMPSAMHETVIGLLRNRPSLAAELLADTLGIDVPTYRQARLDPTDCTDLAPTEYRADAVVVLSDEGGPVLAVVVEVQLRPDPAKRWSWPVYLSTLRSRLRCPTELLVVCTDPTTASWCATPIGLGLSGSVITPLVVGPDRIPVVADGEHAVRSPELAVLSALAHTAHPRHTEVLDVLAETLATVEKQQAILYLRLVLAALPQAARHHLEELMKTGTHSYQSEFTEQLRDEGRVEGKVQAVLTVLAAGGVEVPADARARITGCADPVQLDTWLYRAVHATSVHDLFD